MNTRTPKGTMDDIITRAPVNKTAARVVSRGVSYESNKKIQTADSDVPIQIRKRPKNSENLSGVRRGRLVAIGLARDVPSRWVVRCDCGTYTLRTAKAMKNEANEQDRCEQCRHLAFLRRNDHFRRTGKNADIRDF